MLSAGWDDVIDGCLGVGRYLELLNRCDSDFSHTTVVDESWSQTDVDIKDSYCGPRRGVLQFAEQTLGVQKHYFLRLFSGTEQPTVQAEILCDGKIHVGQAFAGKINDLQQAIKEVTGSEREIVVDPVR